MRIMGHMRINVISFSSQRYPFVNLIMTKKELPKSYNPADYEDEIYQKWERSGFFNPDKLIGEPYSIMMPPPNVTGVLHLGHALENSLMDLMARYQRMRGRKVLLLPGTDHAAVATQAKVEKLLVEQGIKNPRQQLGREKLLEKIKAYAEQSKATILQQIKKLGTSCDWSRLAYTFDETRNGAVNEVFAKMFQDGLIYRGKRIVNWDAKLQTTISDDEIVWHEEKTPFYYFKYGPFVISTARPETKFGDKYVVMHPDDQRYKKYQHGDKFDCEWINGKVTATVIKDKAIDQKFGTGVMTITPWHDMVDFEIAQRHNLDAEQIIDFQGKLMPIAGEFSGRDILEARSKIIEKLKAKGLVVKVNENYLHRVAKCYRSNGLVEPQIKEQWFVAVNKKIPGRGKSLKDLMKEAVTVGHQGDKRQKINITPDRFNKIYLNWIDNLRDWCISRQIWWGHRIPVWYKRMSNVECRMSNKSVQITYFVHGTSLDNEKGLSSGYSNTPLSKLGIKQSQDLKSLVKEKFDAVFSSDLERARHTAEIVFGKNIILDKRLREVDYGQLTRKNEELVLAGEKDYIEKPFPQGESYQEVENRMRSFLKDIFNKYQGKKVAIMAHKGPQLALEVILNNKTWQQALAEDWRKKKAWQPGWKYQFVELKPKVWELKIYGKDIFEAIKNGSKTIETRAGRAKSTGKDWSEFKNGEIIKFYLADEKTDTLIKSVEPIERSVKSVKHFKNIDLMFKKYNPEQDYPGKSLKQIKQWWAKRPALAERIKQYGIWAIELGQASEQEIYVGVEPPEGENWHQDEDTLDTWFSSGLWTFSTLGFPEQTKDLKTYHPTSWMQMGYEILFFWMARMILMSTYALDQIPFKDVYIHGMLRDELGKKFSKSAGNNADPLEIIKQYGTDALRFSLLSGVTPGNDQKFYEEKIEGARNLVNKLWNVARYIITNCHSGRSEERATDRISSGFYRSADASLQNDNLTLADRWILGKMDSLIVEVTEDLENYRFSQAGEKLREFSWSDLADWYIEASKFEKNGEKGKILSFILQNLLKLWHPFMPFVTEHIWTLLDEKKLLMVANWPDSNKRGLAPLGPHRSRSARHPLLIRRGEGEVNGKDFELIKEIIIAIRNARSIYRIEPGKKIKAVIYTGGSSAGSASSQQAGSGLNAKNLIESQVELIKKLRTGVDKLEIKRQGEKIKQAIYLTVGGAEIYLIVPDFDFAKEKDRLNKKIKLQRERIKILERKLTNKEFTAKAPVEIVTKEQEKLKLWLEELKKLREQLKSISH